MNEQEKNRGINPLECYYLTPPKITMQGNVLSTLHSAATISGPSIVSCSVTRHVSGNEIELTFSPSDIGGSTETG